jgi:hypothetical protein
MKKMKRNIVVCLLAVMIAVFGFNLTVFGQVCKECSKCPIGNVPCPETKVIPGPQGQTTTTTETVNPFDYDGEPYAGDFGAYGYCKGFNFDADATINDPGDSRRDCKFVFDICSCPEACEVVPGSEVGIQMIIKTPGVYFAAPAAGIVEGINFDIRRSPTEDVNPFCEKNDDGTPKIVGMQGGEYYYDADDNLVAYRDNATRIETGIVRNFPDVRYYRQFREYTNEKGKFVSEVSTEGTPLAGSKIGALDDANKVVALESVGEYMFNEFDAPSDPTLKRCHLWIDIPPMRIDPTIAQKGDRVKIVVRLVFNRQQAGICPTCIAPDYCECEREIAIICCDETAVAGQGCMYFPYALFNAPGGWSTGIAITKNDATVTVANMEATLTLTDQADNKFTYKKTDFTTPVWAFVLDSIMGSFTPVTPGTTPMGPAGSLKVDGNFSMDGYNFMNAGEFGCGTMPRGCCNNAACGP